MGVEVPFTLGGVAEEGGLVFSSSWNLEMRLTRLAVSARPAYIVFGLSFLSLRWTAL